MYSRCFLIRNTESETKTWQSIEGCAFKAQMKKAASSWSNKFPTVPLKIVASLQRKATFFRRGGKGKRGAEGDKSSKADERIQLLRKICTCFEERWQYQDLEMAKHLQLWSFKRKIKSTSFSETRKHFIRSFLNHHTYDCQMIRRTKQIKDAANEQTKAHFLLGEKRTSSSRRSAPHGVSKLTLARTALSRP